MFKVKLKTDEEIEAIRKSSLLVGKTLAEVAKHLDVGVECGHLDKIAETFIKDHGGTPSFKGYRNYPASLCISVNHVVVHGIPRSYRIQNGDIVSIDCGVCLNGWHGDFAYTFEIGHVALETALLVERTKASLYKGVEKATQGNKIGDISHAVQTYVESFGYGVVRELIGHGIGRKLHEKPDVPNYGKPDTGMRIQAGMVFCIEPMINMGTPKVLQAPDGWTVLTADRKPSAHFEHQVAITSKGTEVLSTYEYIEEVLNKK